MNRVRAAGIALTAFSSTLSSASAAAYTAEYASQRDNAAAWSAIKHLKQPAWELSSFGTDYSPGYQLFLSRAACAAVMKARVNKKWDLMAECHPVSPNQRKTDYWDIIVFPDSYASHILTETRFADHANCVNAAGLVVPIGKIQYAGICAQFGTRALPETGE